MKSPTRAGGGWLTAPLDQNYPITTHDSIVGLYHNGATLPIIHGWTVQRVE